MSENEVGSPACDADQMTVSRHLGFFVVSAICVTQKPLLCGQEFLITFPEPSDLLFIYQSGASPRFDGRRFQGMVVSPP